MSFPIPENEESRLEALREYNILDSPVQDCYDDFSKMAAFIAQTPIASVAFMDKDRHWFKSKVGQDFSEVPRKYSFSTHAILTTDGMMVEDCTKDPRFALSPLVTSKPYIRFYFGIPLITIGSGHAIGTLSVLDQKPRSLTAEQKSMLEVLARQIMVQLELRKISTFMKVALADVKKLSKGIPPACVHCKEIPENMKYWN